MRLSPNEIAWLALKHWTGNDVRIAVAVAIAESGGDTLTFHRSTTGENLGNVDHGVWQISNRWNGAKLKAHPNWRDPEVNAVIAREVYDEFKAAGKDPWSAWAVYISKSYEKYLPDADIAIAFAFPPPQYQ